MDDPVLTEKDEKDIDEVIRQSAMTEAIESLNITGYYKGFKVGLTKRSREANIKPYAEDAMRAVEWLLSNGWKPSWADDTNNAQTGVVTRSGVSQTSYMKPHPKVDPKTCAHINWETKVSSGKKNPKNVGRQYTACLDCGSFLGFK